MDGQLELMLSGSQFKKLLDEQVAEIRKKYNMKKAELDIIYFLAKNGEQNTSTDIHNYLMMNKGHISQAVESLCSRHFLVAIPDKQDRRYIHYKVTQNAKEIIDELIHIRTAMTEAIFEGVTAEELTAFKQIAKKVSDNIKKML